MDIEIKTQGECHTKTGVYAATSKELPKSMANHKERDMKQILLHSSLSREPAFSSSRNELARLCLCKTPWASLWVMKTEKWEFHEAFATHHSKMAQKPSTLVLSHSAIGVKGFLSTGLAEFEIGVISYGWLAMKKPHKLYVQKYSNMFIKL